MYDDTSLTEEELDGLIGLPELEIEIPDEPTEEELDRINGSIDSDFHDVVREE